MCSAQYTMIENYCTTNEGNYVVKLFLVIYNFNLTSMKNLKLKEVFGDFKLKKSVNQVEVLTDASALSVLKGGKC